MKRFLSLALVAVMVCLAFAACGSTTTNTTTDDTASAETEETAVALKELVPVELESCDAEDIDYSNVKVGLITLHDDSSTYDKNFIDAMYRAFENLGLSEDQLVLYTGIDESEACYNTAKECVNQGCNVVFADSFGHEDYVIQAASEYPDVKFCHATGTKAHTVGLDNFSNAFASIYEGRYAVGIAAGMKLNEMIANGEITEDEAVMGYVGAYTYAEVMSGYTSFYLGAKSVCPSVTMKVSFTGSWYDPDKEQAAAESLISQGCVLISQHADSMGAPQACEAAGVPNISYNVSTQDVGKTTYITSCKIDWTPYFEYMIKCAATGQEIADDWTGTVATGSVQVIDVNEEVAAEGTKDAIDAALEAFKAGELSVFDTANFTVGGETLTSYGADVDTDANYEADTEVIVEGVFLESTGRSAPYFNVEIDGIELLDRAY